MKISLGGSKKTTAVKPKPKPKPSALFEEEEEDEQDQPSPADALAMTLRQRSTSRSKVQQKLEQALQEDPSVFDYDDVLPQLTNDRKRVQEAKKARSASTKSKYIETLMAKAEQRQFEFERVREAQILKQIEAEKEIFGEKPTYTTKKYKEHLKERQKWEEEQERIAAQEEDVTKQANLNAFYYSNFYNQIGDRLADSDPLKAVEAKKQAAIAKEEEQEAAVRASLAEQTSSPPPSSADTPGSPMSDTQNTESTHAEEKKDEDEEMEPLPLTREQKVEQARERYFARRRKREAAKSQDNDR